MRSVFFAIWLLGPLLSNALGQQVVYVDCANPNCPGSGTESDPYCVIQDAIVAARDGDTVLVSPCTYLESIDFLGKRVRVISAEGPEATTIDADHQSPVVTFQNGEPPETSIEGFTLRNGSGQWLRPRASIGGGILCMNGSSPTILNNTITGSIAAIGGGIACLESSPAIVNNDIFLNRAAQACGEWCPPNWYYCCVWFYGYGAAVYSSFGGAPLVLDNLITDNPGSTGVHILGPTVLKSNTIRGHDSTAVRAVRSEVIDNLFIQNNGLSISCSVGLVEGNTITETRAPVLLNGAIYANDSMIRNNIVSKNGPSIEGIGAIRATRCEIVSNLIVENQSARNGHPLLRLTDCRLLNNTISGNVLHPNSYVVLAGGTRITNSIIWGNIARASLNRGIHDSVQVAYSCIEGGFFGVGNFDADPMFRDSDDYRLRCDSPCVDAGGAAEFSVLPSLDVSGKDRRRIGRIDIGADELGTEWEVVGEFMAGGTIHFEASAAPTQPEPSISEVYLSLGRATSESGIRVPRGSGRFLDLAVDSLLIQWLSLDLFRQVTRLNGCAGATSASFQIPAGVPLGVEVHFAGVTWDFDESGIAASVSRTKSFVIQ